MTPPPGDETDEKASEPESEQEMAEADEANGEGRADGAVNDTEARYGDDESPT